jgi:Ser/Thr protein kinase RdoA (MazF antagonist)
METLGDVIIAPDAIAVAAGYGLGTPVAAATVAARGELGRIWRLETIRGTWAVKELLRFDAQTVEQAARADVVFQEAAIRAGIPMPRPVLAKSGDVTTRFDDREGGTRRVRVYSWVDLAPRTIQPRLHDVAAILGRLHSLDLRTDQPPDPWFTVPPPVDRLEELLAAASADRVPWLSALARLVPIVAATLARIPDAPMAPAITCHLDFNPENVLVDRAGRTVVVDWENSGPAPAEQELASVVAEFVHDTSETVDALDAYAAAGGSARLVDRSSFRLTVVVQANLVETYARRALSVETSAEDRARCAHWIEEIAANAFSVDRVDAWLAAAAGSNSATSPVVE